MASLGHRAERSASKYLNSVYVAMTFTKLKRVLFDFASRGGCSFHGQEIALPPSKRGYKSSIQVHNGSSTDVSLPLVSLTVLLFLPASHAANIVYPITLVEVSGIC